MNHSVLLYGAFGAGKTTLAVRLAKRLLKPGQTIRLLTAEHANSVRADIEAGIVQHCQINIRNNPFDALRKTIRDGLWPINPEDPKSKWAETNNDSIRIYEGGATFSNYLSDGNVIGGIRQRTAAGESIGINEGGKINFTDGDEQIGGVSQTSYKIIQDEMESLMVASLKRPGLAIWTSHEDIIYKRIKTPTGQVINGTAMFGGVEIYGGALTGSIGRHFADVWRIGITGNDRFLYVKNHVDEELKWLAKNSAGDERQDQVPDRFRLTDEKGLPKRNAAGQIDIADRIVKALWEGK
jgi:hypothetical protein